MSGVQRERERDTEWQIVKEVETAEERETAGKGCVES